MATLFKKSKSGINKATTRARKILIEHFFPLYLGIKLLLLISIDGLDYNLSQTNFLLTGTTHLSREELLQNHTRRFAQILLDSDGKLILIADGTYIYIYKKVTITNCKD